MDRRRARALLYREIFAPVLVNFVNVFGVVWPKTSLTRTASRFGFRLVDALLHMSMTPYELAAAPTTSRGRGDRPHIVPRDTAWNCR